MTAEVGLKNFKAVVLKSLLSIEPEWRLRRAGMMTDSICFLGIFEIGYDVKNILGGRVEGSGDCKSRITV